MFDTKLPLYVYCVLIALIANIIVVISLSRKYNYKIKETIFLVLFENFGIILGAKLYWFFENMEKAQYKFDFFSSGMSSYGGLFGTLICIILFKIIFKKNLKELLYIFIPQISIMYSISKIGCFLVGCCYGIEYNGIGKVIYNYSIYHENPTYLFPVQIVESIVFMAIFIYNMVVHKKNNYDMKTVGINFIMCGFAKFALEFLRASHVGVILSSTQFVSILFISLGIVIYAKKKLEERN